MSKTINTKDFIKSKKVSIDGMDWEFTAPGAGTSLKLMKLNGIGADASQEEISKATQALFEAFTSMFKDRTKNNSQVKKWLNDTPLETISLVVAEVQK